MMAKLRTLVVTCALLLVVQAEAMVVARAAPAVGVRNVPPQFRHVALGAQGGYQFINVTVSDFNTWHDILRVDVVILDDYGGILGQVRFRQYVDINSTYVPSTAFEDLAGGLLRRQVSYYWASNLTDTYVERSEVNLTFGISPVRASYLDLVAMDLQGATAEVTVDYSIAALGLPGTEPFLPPPFSSVDLSTLIALIFATFMTTILMIQRYGGLVAFLRRLRGEET